MKSSWVVMALVLATALPAVGVPVLPLGVAVEVDAIVAIKA